MELELAAARQRLHANPAVAELAVAAGLLLMPALHVSIAAHGLAVGDLGRMQLHIDVVLTPQTRHDDLDVLLPVARQQELLGLRIAVEAQARVLFENLVNGMPHAVFVGAGLGENGVGDGRLRQFDGRISDGRRFIVQRVTRQRVLQLGHGSDVPGPQFGNRAQVLALQDAQMRELLGLARPGVDQDGVVLQYA